MATRIPSHQLSSGLYVSGLPDQHKERQPVIVSKAVPYTGGDVKKSGELGKMFDIHVVEQPTTPPSSSRPRSGSLARSASNSGPQQLPAPTSGSGPQSSRKSSGPLSSAGNPAASRSGSGSLTLQPTGLITSGPVSSGRRPSASSSGPADSSSAAAQPPAGKVVYGASVTNLSNSDAARVRFSISKSIVWVSVVVFMMALIVGIFMLVTVKKAVILFVIAGVATPVVVLLAWNLAWGKRGLLRFLANYPDAELRAAKDGQYVKVTGVVTCGSIPLESSYQRIPRCIYVSTGLYEYRGWGAKPANSNHRCFTWGLRHLERYVADFYISDFQSGLRALVKAGYGAKVSSFVKPVTVVDITKENKELSPSFLRWLADRKLSADDRIMRLEEGYIKEGSTVSVMGIVRRHDNVLMIVPSTEPVSTGCRWKSCLLPTTVHGLILTCDENLSTEVIAV
ncbi:uncharacterized membrane protein At1g16860 [Nymphaea colorata]|nr:uncharacterized membrane protein At1g16860 [Nymphaea colorata]